MTQTRLVPRLRPKQFWKFVDTGLLRATAFLLPLRFFIHIQKMARIDKE